MTPDLATPSGPTIAVAEHNPATGLPNGAAYVYSLKVEIRKVGGIRARRTAKAQERSRAAKPATVRHGRAHRTRP